MPNALAELIEALSAERLPMDYPIRGLSAAMVRLGYTETVRGSHYKWSKPNNTTIVVAVHREKVPAAALRDIRALLVALGLI